MSSTKKQLKSICFTLRSNGHANTQGARHLREPVKMLASAVNGNSLDKISLRPTYAVK